MVVMVLLLEFYPSPEGNAQRRSRPLRQRSARRSMPCKNHPFVEDRLTRCSRCAEAFCPDCIVEIGGLPYCSDCKTESMRDLLSGVPFRELDMASVGRRLVALLIDGMIVLVPCIGLAFAVTISIGFLDEAEA